MQPPILILQTLRIGDLVLSFPLFFWLARKYPNHPIWVVSEYGFAKELAPISPEVTYFSWDMTENIKSKSYFLVINLSHESRAAQLAGELTSDGFFGPVHMQGRGTYIHGNWSLYRASLVKNNRHNRFHWADLNCLDVIPFSYFSSTTWPEARKPEKGNNKIGLFLGASQKDKRPTASVWSKVANGLLSRGYRPILLGGKQEIELGHRVMKSCKAEILNLCGTLSLSELCKIGQTLSLLITPDTGPMHVAAWAGTQVLNLSLGPVHPWETGPYNPGHFVLQPTISCRECWVCRHPGPVCQEGLSVHHIISMVQRILDDKEHASHKSQGFYAELYGTGRGDRGLYALQRLIPEQRAVVRDELGTFWQQFWLYVFEKTDGSEAKNAWCSLVEQYPAMDRVMKEQCLRIGSTIKASIKDHQIFLDANMHDLFPPLVRPITGYLQHFVTNGDLSPEVMAKAIQTTEQLISCTS